MPPKPNISLVARQARVAKSTVSRVLNGGPASVEVRERVQGVIKQLGYTPLTTARNLALGQAGSIGLVVANSQGSWFLRLLGGVEEELSQRHISMLLGTLEMSGRYDSGTVASWIEQRRVDGIIFCRPTVHESNLIGAARRVSLPISLIAPDEPFDFGQVFSSRNKSAGEEVAAHLWELGHRRIAFVGGPKESIDTRERLQGLQDALARWGTRLGPRNIRYWPDYVAQGGHDYAQRWLKMTPEQAPTAIVFGNDALALGFMRSALLKGVRIPDQVSVVGFDDSPEAGLVYPGLTTARQEARALGAAACRSLLERIDVPQQRATARIEFPMSLIVRESTGRAPG